MAGFQTEPAPSNAIVVAVFAPVNATMPQRVGGGAHVVVQTEYPFGDVVAVTVDAEAPVTLKLRIPGWAINATITATTKLKRRVSSDLPSLSFM